MLLYATVSASLVLYAIYFASCSRKGILRALYSLVFDKCLAKLVHALLTPFMPLYKALSSYLSASMLDCIGYLYISLTTAGFGLMNYQLAYKHFDKIGLAPVLAIYAFFGLAQLFYVSTWLRDPGYITKANSSHYVNKYRKYFEGGVFVPNTICSTCKVVK